jgi:hypothetical protein
VEVMLRLDVILNDLIDKICRGLIPVSTYRMIDPHSSEPVYKAGRQKVNEA